jgi:ketosteroid isomerase-like protein
MRTRWKYLPVTLWLVVASAAACADSRANIEQEVRRLDAREADAVLHGDFAVIDGLWADDFIVNNPFNSVGFGREGRVRGGVVSYSAFQRFVEFVALRGDVAIVMGREVVVPKAPSADAGRTLHRRYTNIWMKSAGSWKLAARHANVIADSTLSGAAPDR